MKDGQAHGGNYHHGSLEEHESDLVIGEITVDAIPQSREPENGTDEDC